MVGVKPVKTWCICALYFQCVVELWMCLEYVLNVFSMCLVGFKIESHIFRQTKYCRKKGELIGILVFCIDFHLNKCRKVFEWKKTANQTKKILNTFLATKRQKSWSHDKKQKPGLCKIQRWFLLIFRPQTKVFLQNPIVSGMTFEGVFEPSFQCLQKKMWIFMIWIL